MPTRRLQFLMVVAALVVTALPGVIHAGDAPIFVVGDWGIGEIDGRIMFYTGRDNFVFTSIPTLPRGPRWDFAYNAFPFAFLAGVAIVLHRRRQTRATERGFEVQTEPKRSHTR